METDKDFTCIQAKITNFWRQNGCFWKVPISIKFKTIEKRSSFISPPVSVELWNILKCTNFLFKTYYDSQRTFGTKIATSENFRFHMHRIKKKVLSESLQFHFNSRTLKDKHIFCSKLVCTN